MVPEVTYSKLQSLSVKNQANNTSGRMKITYCVNKCVNNT